MKRFYGFDLGDAESSVSVLDKNREDIPSTIPISGSGSFITAYARLEDASLLIGENACYSSDASETHLRFKSRFLTDKTVEKDIAYFAGAVREELEKSGEILPGEDISFYVGCPAGWDKQTRERYRKIFERVGYPPVKIVSESRAAMVSACNSRYLQVGYDILSHPVLVVDIGSSTTDFAYILGGREVSLQTAGEVALGGGLMDEWILDVMIERAENRETLREIMTDESSWRSYSEFAARHLKEEYFADEAYWKENGLERRLSIYFRGKQTLTLHMDQELAHRMLYGPMKALEGKSFCEAFQDSLKKAREGMQGTLPELVILTGGVSRLPAIQDWCRQVFPDAVMIRDSEPEFAVSKGLSWCGKTDAEMAEFRMEVGNLRESSVVEQIVGEHIEQLYEMVVDSLTTPMLEEAVFPVIERWRYGQIRRLSDIDGVLEKELSAWLQSDRARQILSVPITRWLKPVGYELEKHTIPICVRYHVPYRALSLNSYLSFTDIDIHVDAKHVFAVEEMTWMIDTIITLIVSLLCGGGGIALISNGLPGIIAGAVLSLMILFLGKDKLQSRLLRADIPLPARRLLRKSYFESRIERLSTQIKADFLERLKGEHSEEISEKLVRDISTQIDDCLVKMAQVVEVPLGA